MGQAGVVTSRFSQRCHTGRPHQRRDAAIFFAIDYCPLEVVGIHAAKRCTRFEALEPILPGVRHSFEALGKDVTKGRTLRHAIFPHRGQEYSDTSCYRSYFSLLCSEDSEAITSGNRF